MVVGVAVNISFVIRHLVGFTQCLSLFRLGTPEMGHIVPLGIEPGHTCITNTSTTRPPQHPSRTLESGLQESTNIERTHCCRSINVQNTYKNVHKTHVFELWWTAEFMRGTEKMIQDQLVKIHDMIMCGRRLATRHIPTQQAPLMRVWNIPGVTKHSKLLTQIQKRFCRLICRHG